MWTKNLGREKTLYSRFLFSLLKTSLLSSKTEDWNRLSREAVKSPPLEIFRTHLDEVLCSLL